MNRGQTRLYWNAWGATARAQGWRGTAAEMRAARPHCFGSPELDSILGNVWSIAEGFAANEHRALSANDLRHACHTVAVGSCVSSKRLSNAELDRVLALLRLFADPDNVKNVCAWLDQEAGERRRHVHVIQQAPPAYWQRIARDKFGHADLDRLSLEQLRQHSLTIRSRTAARKKAAIAEPALAPATSMSPEQSSLSH